MKKLIAIIIIVLLGGVFWYSRTEKVVDEPAPAVPGTEEVMEDKKDDEKMTIEEKLADPAMMKEIIPEDVMEKKDLPADVMEKVDAMMEKAETGSMSQEELNAMEVEMVRLMNPGIEAMEVKEDDPAMMAMKGDAMMMEADTKEEGEAMMKEAMEAMMDDGTLMDKEAMAAVAATRQGSFAGADAFHQGSGLAIIIPAADTVRLENFSVTRGPDLFVTAITKSGNRVTLGVLKGNAGNQNYTIPGSLDPDDIASIQIWCRAFNITFATAVLF